MDLPANPFKHALERGEPQIGLWSSLCSANVAEVLRDAGYDWIVVDTEHAANELPDVIAQMRALRGGSAMTVVRPAWNDAVLIKRLLDSGAQTLLVPFVQSVAEAEAAVAAVRYPPRGVRGVATATRANLYGRVPGYFARAEAELCLLVQVETASALAQIADIAAVDGVDGVFIGPSDLAAAMGHLGEPAHPEVQAAIAAGAAACRQAGKPAGILSPVEAEVRRYLDLGFTFVAVGSDLGCLRDAAAASLRHARAHIHKAR